MFKQNTDIFNILFEAVSEGIIVVDENQTIVANNKIINTMFDYNLNELLEKKLQILIPQKYQVNHKTHFENFYRNNEKRKMGRGNDLYGVTKNGVNFPIEVGLNPFTIYGKTYVMALVVDITKRKKEEQEHKHWTAIFNESLNEIYIFSAKTLKFIDVNYGAQKNIGYSLSELKQLTTVDLKREYNEAQFRKLIRPLVTGKERKLEFEAIHYRKDKTRYPVEVHLQLSKLGNDEVLVAIILDITERKNYTLKLEQTVKNRTQELKLALSKEKELNELKTKFLSLVSHEFKTPLSGILTSAILLEKYKLSEQQEKRDKHIKTITDKVYFLTNILNDFLSIERLDSGKVNYKFTNFNLSKIINELVYNANMLLKKGQHIIISKNIDEYNLYQDEKFLELALSNLIYNAIKYSSENTTIVIEAKQIKNNIIIKVIDQGIGIPINDQKYIFDRYFRSENVIDTQGTGIGLNIAKNHLKNLGGSIKFISKENKGSTFIIEIPINNKL